MRQSINISLVCVWLLAGAARASSASQSSGIAELKAVRYYDRVRCSHLVLKLDGDCSYSTSGEGTTVLLVLAGIRVSSAHDGARFHFSTGLVNSTNIDRLGVDSALVTISLKPHTAYRIGRSDSVGGLLVTLFRDSDPALTKDVSHVAEAPDQGDRPPVIQPVHTFTLNGMTAVENSPSEGPGKDVAQGEKHSTLKSTLLSEIRHLPESHLLPMALSFVSATLGTGLLLLLSRQRNTPRLRTAPAAVGAGFPEVLSTHIRDGSRGFERTEPRRHQAHRPSREDASALDIARKYGRGLGEINLSLALKAHQGGHVWAQKLEKIVDKGNDMHDRASVAKELRVGRGEVDLAMVFRHLTSSQTVREGPK